MALRSAPARELELNAIYSRDNGPGFRAYVFGRINLGEKVPALAARLEKEHGIDLPASTLYEWTRRWRREAKEKREAVEQSRSGRKRSRQTAETAQPESAAA